MDAKTELPGRLGYSPDDFPRLTSGTISRTRVYVDMRSGKVRAKKVGQRTLITVEEAQRYIDSFPDREPNEEAEHDTPTAA
jgi:hypothetical protein